MIKYITPLSCLLVLSSSLSNCVNPTEMPFFSPSEFGISQEKSQQYDSMLEEYRALHHRHKTVVDVIKDLKSGPGLGWPVVLGYLGAGAGAAVGSMASERHNQAEYVGMGALICGGGAFVVTLLVEAISRLGKDVSEYERERDQLEKAFLDQECVIIKEGSTFDKEYIRNKLEQESNRKLKEILQDLIRR